MAIVGALESFYPYERSTTVSRLRPLLLSYNVLFQLIGLDEGDKAKL